MYESIEGRLVQRRPDRAIIEAGGIGYRILIPLTTFERLPAKEGSKARLLLHHYQREDRQALYGFATQDERDFFEVLTGVSGVGPALGLGILSSMPFDEFRGAVSAGDAAALTRVKGVGKKLAGRILVELTEAMKRLGPVSGASTAAATGPAADAALALVTLGVDRSKADTLAAEAAADLGDDATPGAIVREALRRQNR
ncbi:MAG: Holliday junction branch migration protein RuvA [Planctomycetota bacterium]|jgi:Holliday junction DNA helicase RuvA